MQQPQDTDTDHDWGIISHGDVALMKELILAAAHKFPQPLKFLEIGFCGCETSNAIYRFLASHSLKLDWHGVDVSSPVRPQFTPHHVYMGDSQYIFADVPDGFHVLFIDGCHCVNHAMLDFLHYAPKVVPGGCVLFHDTNPSPEWQGQIHHGHGPNTPSFGRAVREAITKLGLMNENRKDYAFLAENHTGKRYGTMAFEKLA